MCPKHVLWEEENSNENFLFNGQTIVSEASENASEFEFNDLKTIRIKFGTVFWFKWIKINKFLGLGHP